MEWKYFLIRMMYNDSRRFIVLKFPNTFTKEKISRKIQKAFADFIHTFSYSDYYPPKEIKIAEKLDYVETSDEGLADFFDSYIGCEDIFEYIQSEEFMKEYYSPTGIGGKKDKEVLERNLN